MNFYTNTTKVIGALSNPIFINSFYYVKFKIFTSERLAIEMVFFYKIKSKEFIIWKGGKHCLSYWFQGHSYYMKWQICRGRHTLPGYRFYETGLLSVAGLTVWLHSVSRSPTQLFRTTVVKCICRPKALTTCTVRTTTVQFLALREMPFHLTYFTSLA